MTNTNKEDTIMGKSKQQVHKFEDGEMVRVKKTGEEKKVDHWWFGTFFDTGQSMGECQYTMEDGSWLSESELEKVVG